MRIFKILTARNLFETNVRKVWTGFPTKDISIPSIANKAFCCANDNQNHHKNK